MTTWRERLSGALDGDGARHGIVALIAVAVIAPVVAMLLVFAADLVPDQRIVDQLNGAIDDSTFSGSDYGPALSGKQIDFFTDCIGITIGLGDLPQHSRWTSSIRNPTLASCSTAVPLLVEARGDTDLRRSWEYFRYWHGYTVVTRPLIATVGLAATRVIVLLSLIGAMLGLIRSLARRHGRLVPLVALSGFVATTDYLELPRSLPHAVGALAAVGGAWAAHHLVAGGPTTGRVVAVSAAAGAVFVFADILTMTPGAWALLVFVVTLAATERWSGRDLALRSAAASAAWIVVWAWTWATKWVIASAVYGIDTVRKTINFTATNRLDGGFEGFDPSLGVTTRINLVAWRDQPLTVPFLVALLATVVVVVGWRLGGSGDDAGFGPVFDRLIVGLPAILPIVWYEVMRNHSQTHFWFTYRSLAISAGIVAAALVVVLPRTSVRPDDNSG